MARGVRGLGPARRRRRAAGAIALAIGLLGRSASAQSSDVERAREAYDAAVAAARRGDHALAASEFDRADRLAPNPVALESALKAALLADDPVLGMQLVERAAPRAASSPALDEAGRRARAAFESRAGRLRIACAAPRCRATVDGRPSDGEAATWALLGEHVVELALDGRTERRVVVVSAAGEAVVEPVAPEPAAPLAPARVDARAAGERARPRGAADAPGPGLSPVWVAVGGGATAVLAGITIASAVDTKSKHDAYERTAAGADEGRGSQTRTNVLFGVTVAAGLATAGVALLAVRWSSGPAATALRVGPTSVGVDARF